MPPLPRQAITTSPAADLLDRLAEGAARFVQELQGQYRRLRTQAIIDRLDVAERRDAGIDRWGGHRPRPTMTVPAGLMAKLQSMR